LPWHLLRSMLLSKCLLRLRLLRLLLLLLLRLQQLLRLLQLLQLLLLPLFRLLQFLWMVQAWNPHGLRLLRGRSCCGWAWHIAAAGPAARQSCATGGAAARHDGEAARSVLAQRAPGAAALLRRLWQTARPQRGLVGRAGVLRIVQSREPGKVLL